jgi:hypothetical protein
MAQPVWITPPGSLGTIAEGIFYEVPLEAYDPDEQPVFYELLAGQLPSGIELDSATGHMAGTPKAVAIVDGVPAQVSRNVTSKFAVRVYTKNILGGIARLADRTFTITIAGETTPEFVTPAGNIATYFDGTQVFNLPVYYTDLDIYDPVIIRLAAGQLPPGLTISSTSLVSGTGVISGYIAPNTDAGVAAGFSRDGIGYDQYPFDYSTRSSTVNYEFVLEITDGKTNNLRSFSILVYSRNSCTARLN